LQKPFVDVVVIPISKPMLVGIYENGSLVEEIKKEGLTSDVLPEVMDEILKRFNIKSLIYAKGPGSYMAIKLAYIFFKTLETVKGIELLAQDGFYFNGNSPIKAVGKSYFVKKEGIITLVQNVKEGEFKLPHKLNKEDFEKDTSPLYVLKAV